MSLGFWYVEARASNTFYMRCHIPSDPGAFSPEGCLIPVILEQQRRQSSCGGTEMSRRRSGVSCQSGGSVKLEEAEAAL